MVPMVAFLMSPRLAIVRLLKQVAEICPKFHSASLPLPIEGTRPSIFNQHYLSFFAINIPNWIVPY